MYPESQSPQPQDDQELFTQLYHGGQDPDQLDEDEQRKADVIKTVNAGVSASAAGGAAAASAMILGQQTAGAGAAGAGAGAMGSGGTAATLVKGGMGLKVMLGAAAGVVVVSGVVVVGVNVLDRGGAGTPDAAPISEAAMDEGIEKFDFENATFTDEAGSEVELTDGRFLPPGLPEDSNEGYHLNATEYADVDGDRDLDAAILLEWQPNAGHTTSYVYLWLWDGDKATQVEYPVTNGYYSSVGGLKAAKNGFTVETTAAPPDISSNDEPVKETITIGVEDGFPVQIEPVFGSADRCPEFPDFPATGPYEDVIPKVAPDDDAPDIGKAEDIKSVHAVWTDRSQAFQGEWMAARVERADGSISCGWIPADAAG
ncbi:hypothetical protein [Stackebrandtia nassauensis]|uniref:Uncharacterized protein n=1 Tax=Stackebrandtia nassauensis (strain DSM 44728 / CIP 108903 / NRRL B-16338 / NBRC 102104 / LLR-40K-21) TaxID=446470 RepID=D3Q2L2_STANL|nr:hypothetical protein [Stackebrandtia nassauensis]ADD45763.1 hypothetical protein Snas_6140 [Stackebrandtia nassauensis DSM 44728]